MRFCVHWPDKT
jgi:hypothetical protein